MSTTTHELAYSLSEQEYDGTIVTNLSIAYHALLSEIPDVTFNVTEELLESNVPSKDTYKKMSISIAQGEKMQLSELVTNLVKRGYTRHSSHIADPGFFVRGDELTIIHPLKNNPITISFFGNSVDRIIEQTSKKKRSITFNDPITTRISC